MLEIPEIKKLMENDEASTKKRLARVGQRYYEGDHDIREYRLLYVDGNGDVREDKNRSNIKISHPFFAELVDQEAQYMLSGKGGFIRSDRPELQQELDAYFNQNENFTAELYDTITGTIAKGFEYMYAYKDREGRTSFQTADSLGVVEVDPQESSDGKKYVIYWYIDQKVRDNKRIRRIQVWNETETYFYAQVDGGAITEDPDAVLNPRPHTIWKDDGDGQTYYEGFGLIPFFRLDNSKKQVSGVKTIKALIDDYDLMSCGLSNNIQDASEVLYVVKGFQGENLDELIQNIRAKKHIGVPDGGDVDVRTLDIPYQARQSKLELDEKNIYRFGMGFNSAKPGDGNVTNVVIKSRYALLDLKCNKLEIRLKQFLRKLLDVVLKEINQRENSDYQQKDVYFVFEREVMTNAQDNANIAQAEAQTRQTEVNTLLNLAGTLDGETLVQLICEQLDIDYEEIKTRLPKEEDPYASAEELLNGAGGHE